MTLPPSSSTRAIAAAISATAKYRERERVARAAAALVDAVASPRRGASCHPSPLLAGARLELSAEQPAPEAPRALGVAAGNSTSEGSAPGPARP